MIVESMAGLLYDVADTDKPGLEHCWYGIPVQRVRGEYEPTARGRSLQYRNSPELLRKAACRIVEA